MDREIENRFKKYNKRKERDIYYLRNVEENIDTCVSFIENLINKIKKTNIEYLDGYELKVANEKRKVIDYEKVEDYHEFMFVSPKVIENIEIDIVLKNEHEEFKIGSIDCDVKWHKESLAGYLNRYEVHLNDISIFEEYKDKGYGTCILSHIPMIISYLYKGEVISVTATTEIFKYDKYRIHDFTYSERTRSIERWLELNGYTRSGQSIKDGEIEFAVFKMSLSKEDNFIDTIDMLKKEISDTCFKVWDYDNKNYIESQIEKCNEIAEKVIDEKYNLWSKEEKIAILEKVKKELIKSYNEEKTLRTNQIALIDNIIKTYNSITTEQLELIEKDKLDDIIIKLYCKSFNLGYVASRLKEMGHTVTNKKGEEKKYSYEQIKYMIEESETIYEDLKKYANHILIANKISQYA